PEEVMDKYGADTLRMCILADNPPDKDQIWSEEGVQGASRFLNRLWDTITEILPKIKNVGKIDTNNLSKEDKELRYITHSSIQRANQGIESNWQFNTAIARIIELTNAVRKYKENTSTSVLREACEAIILLIAPITPHIAEELWSLLGYTTSVFKHKIPEVDENALQKEEIPIVVQINGKLRGNFTVPVDISPDEIREKAISLEKIQPYLQGKKIKKVIYVFNKLVNIVVE
ncbi:MAG: class I tRNA ligase family protein, partial [Chitinispirillaceae bacterium]|nr:class I tRNA ligase family protein [Chitinispirillaceae bacterium]